MVDDNKEEQDMSKEEQIGYHKGALHTLSKEREELTRLVGIVDHLIKMHVGALKDHGVDVEEQQKQNQEEKKEKKKKPIEDIL